MRDRLLDFEDDVRRARALEAAARGNKHGAEYLLDGSKQVGRSLVIPPAIPPFTFGQAQQVLNVRGADEKAMQTTVTVFARPAAPSAVPAPPLFVQALVEWGVGGTSSMVVVDVPVGQLGYGGPHDGGTILSLQASFLKVAVINMGAADIVAGAFIGYYPPMREFSPTFTEQTGAIAPAGVLTQAIAQWAGAIEFMRNPAMPFVFAMRDWTAAPVAQFVVAAGARMGQIPVPNGVRDVSILNTGAIAIGAGRLVSYLRL